MNLIKTDDGTFDLNLTFDELAMIKVWSMVDSEQVRETMEQIRNGNFSGRTKKIGQTKTFKTEFRFEEAERVIFKELCDAISQIPDEEFFDGTD